MKGPAVTPWYPGISGDHIYATCPAYRKNKDFWGFEVGKGPLHPDAGDVCGWCLRIWRVRK